MTRKLFDKIFFWIIAAIFLGGFAISGIRAENAYPFYSGMMYVDAYSGDDLHLIKSFCTDHSGKEFPVTELDLWYQENTYYDRMWDLATQAPLNEENKKSCQTELKRFVLDVQQRCQKLSVYHYYWTKFTGPTKDQPTTREFLCELEVRDAGKL